MVTLQPVMHRKEICIAILWNKNSAIERIVRNFMGRQFSITLRCWYIPYAEKALADLKQALETVSTVTIRDNIEQCLPTEILLPEKPVVEVPCVYRETLQRLRYSASSISNHVSQFNAFLLFIHPCDHANFKETHVYDYLLHLVN